MNARRAVGREANFQLTLAALALGGLLRFLLGAGPQFPHNRPCVAGLRLFRKTLQFLNGGGIKAAGQNQVGTSETFDSHGLSESEAPFDQINFTMRRLD